MHLQGCVVVTLPRADRVALCGGSTVPCRLGVGASEAQTLHPPVFLARVWALVPGATKWKRDSRSCTHELGASWLACLLCQTPAPVVQLYLPLYPTGVVVVWRSTAGYLALPQEVCCHHARHGVHCAVQMVPVTALDPLTCRMWCKSCEKTLQVHFTGT